MSNGKLVLVEKSIFVAIRNAAGAEVGFATISEFDDYCSDLGVSLTGKTYLDYEPDRSLLIDENLYSDELNHYTAPVTDYETLISNVAVIQARVADAFYGMNLTEARALRVTQLKAEAQQVIYGTWPAFKQDNYALGVTGYTDSGEITQLKADIASVISACDTAETSVAGAADVDAVKAVSASFPTL